MDKDALDKMMEYIGRPMPIDEFNRCLLAAWGKYDPAFWSDRALARALRSNPLIDAAHGRIVGDVVITTEIVNAISEGYASAYTINACAHVQSTYSQEGGHKAGSKGDDYTATPGGREY